jgi:hypothetical protein
MSDWDDSADVGPELSPVDELLSMSPDEHLRTAAVMSTRPPNPGMVAEKHLAVQNHLLWAIAKRDQE